MERPTQVKLDCPRVSVAHIIGKKGSMIKQLTARSRANIQIDQNVPAGAPCKLTIYGSAAAVKLAQVGLGSATLRHGGHPTPACPALTRDTTRHDTTRHDTTRHDTTRHDTTRHDATRHDTTHYTT